MLKLINISNSDYTLKNFNYDYNQLKGFLNKNNIDGVELIQYDEWNEESIPKDIIKGFHMRFYPIWLDFWRDNKSELIRQFDDMETVEKFYGGKSKEVLIDYYRREIEIASKIGVEYVVFHVCHVELEHCYTYDFTYTDEEIIEAAIEFINEIFKDTKAKFKLLLENLWWPGLTLKNKRLAERLIQEINYHNKGFMLDTAHLMNTNPYLTNEVEAVEYMLDVIDNLGEMKEYIKGIHLNSSLSGEYVLQQINENKDFDKDNRKFFDKYIDVYSHISKIDGHKPFRDKSIKKLVEQIDPEYVVYELLTSSLEELEDGIKAQDKALCLL